jgi:hypothetical protein
MTDRLAIKQAEMRQRMERRRQPKRQIAYISVKDGDDLIAEKLASSAPHKQFGGWIGYPRIERVRFRLKQMGFRFRSKDGWNTVWAEKLENL